MKHTGNFMNLHVYAQMNQVHKNEKFANHCYHRVTKMDKYKFKWRARPFLNKQTAVKTMVARSFKMLVTSTTGKVFHVHVSILYRNEWRVKH